MSLKLIIKQEVDEVWDSAALEESQGEDKTGIVWVNWERRWKVWEWGRLPAFLFADSADFPFSTELLPCVIWSETELRLF